MKSQDLHKVIFVESASAMGGVQFSTLYLAQSLDRARWYPIVLCPEPGDLPNACQADDIEDAHRPVSETSIDQCARRPQRKTSEFVCVAVERDGIAAREAGVAEGIQSNQA
jgi:hypothetical protein